ncbi:MAG: 6-phosphogluconolactonase [Granulosicoccus sp.]
MNNTAAKALCEKTGISWYEEANAQVLAVALARFVADALQAAIGEHGEASLVVSGGSTPAPVFHQLSQTAIDWSKVCVTLADERWVPPGHADSNESLVRETLLVDKAATARFVSLYREGAPESAIDDIARDVDAMPHPFTVTILGMGGDGHTASLFPDAPPAQLEAAMDLENEHSVALLNPPSVDQLRITLTRAALLKSVHRVLHITGDGKRQVLADALSASVVDDGIPGRYTAGLKPIVGLLTTRAQVASVFWSQ